MKGDVVGFAEYLPSKPVGYHCHVHCAGVSGMGGTQKLQADVERTGVEQNLRNRGKTPESRKKPLHQS
jgi:hypothetical protein